MLELQMKKLLWLCTDQLFIKMVIILQNSKLSEFQVLTTNLITKLQAHDHRVLSLIISKAQVTSFPDDIHNQMVG